MALEAEQQCSPRILCPYTEVRRDRGHQNIVLRSDRWTTLDNQLLPPGTVSTFLTLSRHTWLVPACMNAENAIGSGDSTIFCIHPANVLAQIAFVLFNHGLIPNALPQLKIVPL